MGYSHVLLDLDGTVIDSCEGVLNAFRYALRNNGLTEPASGLAFVMGPPLYDSFLKICADPALARQCVVTYRVYYTDRGIFECRVYPGIPELLVHLRDNRIGVGIATSKPEPFARRILRHFGLLDLFDEVGGADMEGPVQQKPDVLRRSMARLGADPATSLMVGDRCYDVTGAHELGTRCAGVLYGYGDRADLAGADYYCDTPLEVLAVALQGPPA